MANIHVVYDPPINNTTNDSFAIDTASVDSVICALKRQISSSRGIDPVQQRLSLEGQPDAFSIPARVVCRVQLNRLPNTQLRLSGFNQDDYSLPVDSQRDNVLDVKWLLSPLIGAQPEHIRLILGAQPLPDHAALSDVLLSSSLLRFWLEYPSKQAGHGAVHRTAAKLLDIDPDFPTIAHSLRRLALLQPNDPHLGTRSFIARGRGDFEWITFKQLNDRVSNLAAGFRSLGNIFNLQV